MKAKFIDKVSIKIKAGNGGNGCKSFYRDIMNKVVADGGSGGDGGNVYIQGNKSINTLIEFSYNDMLSAENGKNGYPNQCNGARGKDLTIYVPLGTECLIEGQSLNITDTDPVLVILGGKGAKGNSLWRHGEPEPLQGDICEFVEIDMQVKTIGDVGLVGFPNAGKSSFLNKISNAKVEVGDYAFTTIKPHLGMWNKTIFVDIPGIIEKASEGKGMGLRFLAHIERCQYLMIMIEATDLSKLCWSFLTLQNELKTYGIDKPYVIVINKIENVKRKDLTIAVKELRKFVNLDETSEHNKNAKVFCISIRRSIGINKLLTFIKSQINRKIEEIL